MKHVVVINGPAGVGKDTLIKFVERILQEHSISVYNISSVDEVKAQLRNEGWDGTKDEYWRQRLVEVKIAHIADNDRPTRYLLTQLAAADENSVLFFHIREAAEIAKLVQAVPQAITIHLDSSRVPRFNNIADTGTHEWQYHHYLRNDGDTKDLINVAFELVKILPLQLTIPQ
jgi:ABC-type cobalamin/Fe3+-siderophores transport system ATPase subunit